MKKFLCAILFTVLTLPAFGQVVEPKKPVEPIKPPAKIDPPKAIRDAHGRGHVTPSAEVLKARHEEAFKRHPKLMSRIPVQLDPAFDCTTKGWAAPVGDQGQCGSCWLYSVVVNVSSAYMKAGYGAGWAFSPQYAMDCLSPQDPCNGGDEYDMFTQAKTNGFVLEKDYGVPYQAAQGTCKYSGQKKYPIADFVYCDPVQGSGQTSIQAIKNAMVQFGMVSIALDASQFNNYSSGVISIAGRNIDHAVNIVGWDDTKAVFAPKITLLDIPRQTGVGALKIQNQWGTSWGMNGFLWCDYNSYLVEGMVCSVTALPPPPTVPVITATTASGVVGQPFFYTISATNSPTGYAATGLPSGLAISGPTISGTPTAIGVSTITLTATNAAGSGTATLSLTVTGTLPVMNTGMVIVQIPGQPDQLLPFSLPATAGGSIVVKPTTTVQELYDAATKKPKMEDKKPVMKMPTGPKSSIEKRVDDLAADQRVIVKSLTQLTASVQALADANKIVWKLDNPKVEPTVKSAIRLPYSYNDKDANPYAVQRLAGK